MVLGNTTQSEALEAAADTGVFGVVDESESPVVEAETKEEGNKREQAKRKALTDTDASHKQAINAIVSTFRSQLVRYADMNLLDFRQVLYVADFYMWVPPALTELKSSVKAKVLIRKRSLWNQFCAEELPKLKKDEDGKWIDPDPPAPEGLEAPEAIGNGNSPSVVDPSLQNPVMPMSSAITEGGGAGDSEADPLDLAALPDRPLSDDECNNREDNDDEKKEFPLTEASKILSRMFKKIQRLDRPRLEGYIQRRDKWNAEMDRGQCVAGFSWLTAADGCDVDLSRHNRNRLTLRSMFKTEMAAWTHILERHGYDILCLFVDSRGTFQTKFATNFGLYFEQQRLAPFAIGLAGFADTLRHSHHDDMRSYISRAMQRGYYSDIKKCVDEKDKEANERKKRQAEAQALASNSTPSVSSGGKKRKANQQQANPPSKTPRHQNSQSISAAPQVIPSSPVLSAIPGPVDPAPSSPAALPLLPNHIDPFLSPATSPNMFSNTRVPSGPSSTSTLHPGPTVNHSLATPVASSSANCAPFTPTRGHAVPATSLSTFAPPITDYLPQTPTGRRYGIAQYSRTPLASSPTVMASAHHRNFATIHLPLSDESASLERKDNDKKAIGELMRNIWNTHFPNSPVTTRMKSKAKADRLLAKAGKKWIAPPGIDVNIDLYEKNKSADKVRILLDGLRRGLVNIVDI